MGDRWVLAGQGLRWSDGMHRLQRALSDACFAARRFWTPCDSVGASTNDRQTMTMLDLGARWVLARHGLVGTRWTLQSATRGLACTDGTGGIAFSATMYAG